MLNDSHPDSGEVSAVPTESGLGRERSHRASGEAKLGEISCIRQRMSDATCYQDMLA